MNRTPLRYPGGKSMMTPFFVDLIKVNDLNHVTYAEAYAGGAGTAINLLLGDYVDRILINDASICIFSFWKSILDDTDRFIDTIVETPVNLSSWRHYKEIVVNAKDSSFELGFATFFLSRTNRSGILTAGPIGGTSQEKQDSATYKIDCRFNKSDLINRIKAIGERKDYISVSDYDALAFLRGLDAGNILVYLDPPYFEQGSSLYLNYYRKEDHQKLADFLSAGTCFKWVLSYDSVERAKDIYSDFECYEFDLKYTAQGVKNGVELLVHSKDLVLPPELSIRRKTGPISLKKI